ncbi:MAG: hypothetical protein MJ128_03635 [Mogibacterium sp.]|nr:hypothetical protein [Mogibacterium sp.]
MKKDKLKITSLLAAVLLVSMVFMTACFDSGDDEDYDEMDIAEGTAIMTIELESDSDNGVEFELEQEDELFDWEESIMVNEADEGGEVQAFDIFPVKAGTTTLRFTCEANDTTYTYECEVGENLDTIKVLKSEGTSGGSAVEPPAPVFESH